MPHIIVFAIVLVVFKVAIDALLSVAAQSMQFNVTPLLLSLFTLLLIAALLGIGYHFFTTKLKEYQRKNDWILFTKKRDVDNEFSKLREGLIKIESKLRKEVALEKSMNMDLVARREKKHENNVSNANKAFQRLVDALYKDKARNLLASVTPSNYENVLQHMLKETNHYQKLIADIDYLGLMDHSDWEALKEKFYQKIELLNQAQMSGDAQAALLSFDNPDMLFTEDLAEQPSKYKMELTLQE